MTTVTVERLAAARLPALGALAFSVALALASQFAVPVPGTPVPITLQPLVVALAGLVLGPGAAAASMTIYLAAGMVGLPVFAPVAPPGIGRLLGPTGGYLLAYPAAAAIAGVIGSRSPARPAPAFVRRAAAAAASILVLYVGGVAQLAVLTGGIGRAIQLGVPPFVAFDVLKALAAAALAGTLAPRRRR
jgi:biotin transport system substrate-specific component